MLTCKEVMKLVSSGALEDGNVSFGERVGIRFHFTICVACQRHRAHMAALKTGARELFRPRETDETRALRKRILDELSKKRK